MINFLIVEDEAELRLLLQDSIQRMGLKCFVAKNVSEAKEILVNENINIILTDVNLKDAYSGLDLVRFVTAEYAHIPIAVMSAYSEVSISYDALRLGAFDFIEKPIETTRLEALANHASSTFNKSTDEHDALLGQLIGESNAIKSIKQKIKKLAKTQAPIFIHGESGTGKEVVANLIHSLSSRADSPFVVINCGAIPSELLESELFGHKKGAFTGAVSDKAGLIRSAHEGTIFLDEIGELPIEMQAKLLRVVQEKKVRPIGSDQEISVDFRVISATHRNLHEMIDQRKFREDLFFRLHVVDLSLPALRERSSDIILLANFFIKETCKNWGVENKTLDDELQSWLISQPFKGNVRELRNIIEKLISLSDSNILSIKDLGSDHLFELAINKIEEPKKDIHVIPSAQSIKESSFIPKNGIEDYLESIEREILINTLFEVKGNRIVAAERLGLTPRSLRYKIDKFKLSRLINDDKEYRSLND